MLSGSEVRLVVLEREHLEEIVKSWNNPEMRIYLGGYMPNSREHEEKWMDGVQERMIRRREFQFVIERASDGKFLGTIGLHDIDWLARSCSLGVVIHNSENWGKGYGTEAIELTIDFARTHLNLRRIELMVHDFNKRALRAYEKVGFKMIGTAHEKSFIDGKYADTHHMELFLTREGS
jgi:RimJ/RimL family protein N-acetyltransferase